MPVSAAKFLSDLGASGLIDEDDLVAAREQAKQQELDGQQVAVQLVKKHKLTAYQAKQLLAGHWRGFFLEKYKILEPIGRGGMGIVYKAEHTLLCRIAAIKLLPRHAASDSEAITRFRREARAIAQLEQENIVRVYDVGQQGSLHFIAMEYVGGESLSKMIKRVGKLPAAEAVSIIYQVALGLEHAASRGIIHRDIKPSNILVTPNGKAKILDMGLVRVFGEATADTDLSLTMSGTVVGTVDYVAPEQADDSHRADVRSDIYSLGCTLYHCLTGQVPFPGGSMMQKLMKHYRGKPKDIGQFASDTPELLVGIVSRMMAKRPADRFQSPGDVVKALAALLPPTATWQPTAAPVAASGSDSSTAIPSAILGPPKTAGPTDNPSVATLPTIPFQTTVPEPPSQISRADLSQANSSPGAPSRETGTIIGDVRVTNQQVMMPSASTESTHNSAGSERKSSQPAAKTDSVSKRPSHPGKRPAGHTPAPSGGESGHKRNRPPGTPQVVPSASESKRGGAAGNVQSPPGDSRAEPRREGTDKLRPNPDGESNRGPAETSVASSPATGAGANRTSPAAGSPPAPNPTAADRPKLPEMRPMAAAESRGDSSTARNLTSTPVHEPSAQEILEAITAAALEGPPSTGSTQRPPRSTSGRRLIWFIMIPLTCAAAGFPLMLWWTGRMGTLVIEFPKLPATASSVESRKPAGRALLDGEPIAITGRSQEELQVSVGSHQIIVDWPGLVPLKDTVTVESGQRVVVELALTEESKRQLELAALTEKTARVSTDDPHHLPVAQLRDELVGFIAHHRGTVEGQQAAAIRSRLPWPADALKRKRENNTQAVSKSSAPAYPAIVATLENTSTGHGPPGSLSVSPDGQLLASAQNDGTILLWDLASQKETGILKGHKDRVTFLAFGPREQSLISVSETEITLWDVAAKKTTRSIAAGAGPIHSAAYCSEKELLAISNGGAPVRIVALASDGEVTIEGARAAKSMAFSQGGDFLAIATAEQIEIHSATTGKKLGTIRSPGVSSMEFSADRQSFAALHSDGAIKIWRVGTWQAIATPEAKCISIAFSPDGQTLLVANQSPQIQGLQGRTGKAMNHLTLELPSQAAQHMVFSPEGRHVAIAGSDGKLYVVRLSGFKS